MNLRPELTISSMIHPLSFVLTGAAVGIAASAEKNFGQMKTLLTPSDAAGQFGAGSELALLAGAILENSPCELRAVGVNGDTQYPEALALLAGSDAEFLLCGSTDPEILQAAAQAAEQTGKFLVVPCGQNPDEWAERFSSRRVLAVFPAIPGGHPAPGAALLAGILSRCSGSDSDCRGEDVLGDYPTVPSTQPDEIERLLARGITVLEPAGVGSACVRAVTTAASPETGEPDPAFRNYRAVRRLDRILSHLRQKLEESFLASPSGRLPLEGVRAAAESSLLQLAQQGLLEHYHHLTVTVPEPGQSGILTMELALPKDCGQVRLDLNFAL